ncbi:MAG: hypothetical protein JWN76_2516 [Chitinophagaceae bacterium]|nr:hypothetical protein [Chitinophagaceae bacterium]
MAFFYYEKITHLITVQDDQLCDATKLKNVIQPGSKKKSHNSVTLYIDFKY